MVRFPRWLQASCLGLTLVITGCEANIPSVKMSALSEQSPKERMPYSVQQHGGMDDDDSYQFPRARVRQRQTDWWEWLLGSSGPDVTVERMGRPARSVEIICTNAYRRCLNRVLAGTETATSCSREYQRCLGRGLHGPDEVPPSR